MFFPPVFTWAVLFFIVSTWLRNISNFIRSAFCFLCLVVYPNHLWLFFRSRFCVLNLFIRTRSKQGRSWISFLFLLFPLWWVSLISIRKPKHNSLIMRMSSPFTRELHFRDLQYLNTCSYLLHPLN